MFVNYITFCSAFEHKIFGVSRLYPCGSSPNLTPSFLYGLSFLVHKVYGCPNGIFFQLIYFYFGSQCMVSEAKVLLQQYIQQLLLRQKTRRRVRDSIRLHLTMKQSRISVAEILYERQHHRSVYSDTGFNYCVYLQCIFSVFIFIIERKIKDMFKVSLLLIIRYL